MEYVRDLLPQAIVVTPGMCASHAGDINTFMYPSSGAEANEAAIRMARLMTGRSKIFTRCVRRVHPGNVR
jgi:4-aminobutyrate aminotransferase-like enzyme